MGGLIGLSVSATVYLGSVFGLYPLIIPAAVCLVISWKQSWRQRKEYLRLVYSKIKRSNCTPKAIVYPFLITVLTVKAVNKVTFGIDPSAFPTTASVPATKTRLCVVALFILGPIL